MVNVLEGHGVESELLSLIAGGEAAGVKGGFEVELVAAVADDHGSSGIE